MGPVTLDYKQTDALGSDNGQALVRDACIKADQFVDFSNYDLNDDGEVDMIYVIFAGGGSHAEIMLISFGLMLMFKLQSCKIGRSLL